MIICFKGEKGGAEFTLFSSIHVLSWYVLLQLVDQYCNTFTLYTAVNVSSI